MRKPVRIATQKILGIKGIEIDRGEYINVVSNPPGVSVFIDGLFEGSAPVKVHVEKPGKYIVKLEAGDYRTWTQKVSVRKNSTYFVNAKLLKEKKPVNPRIKALQDGRVPFIAYATLFSAASSDALLFAFGSQNVRLYVGLPLVVAPLTFFLALNATRQLPMDSGRALMIISSSLWGSLLGLGIPYVFNVQNPAVIYATMLSGSLVGSAAAFILTRQLTEGRNIENLSSICHPALLSRLVRVRQR